MNQGQKNFIGSYENMLYCYNEWGVSLLEDIKDLDKNTSHQYYKRLEDGITDYVAMAEVIGATSSIKPSNFCQLPTILRKISKELGYQNRDMTDLISKLNITEEIRELFHKEY